jgi:hypothetical protein
MTLTAAPPPAVVDGNVRLDSAAPAATVHIPAAGQGGLFLGTGERVPPQAMMLLAESGSTAVWVGEQGVRYYAHGRSLAQSTRLLEAQAKAVCSSCPVVAACREKSRRSARTKRRSWRSITSSFVIDRTAEGIDITCSSEGLTKRYTFSPDGSRILFLSTRETDYGGLYTMKVNGTDTRLLKTLRTDMMGVVGRTTR